MFRRLDDKSFSVSYVFCLALCLLVLAGCETRHVGSLSPVETPVPDAQPCGEGCPDGTVCVPVINDDGEPIFSCIDVHLRYCSPCLEDNDCIDAYMPEAGSLCVGWEDGSGSFCATDCSQHADCPDGAYCKVREDGRAVCMPEGGECSCSQWAIDNEARTRCSTTNTHGTCSGVRVCEPDGLTDCDAATPVQEICNGADDNCDGLADDVFPEQEVACDGDDPDQCNDGTTVFEYINL